MPTYVTHTLNQLLVRNHLDSYAAISSACVPYAGQSSAQDLVQLSRSEEQELGVELYGKRETS